MLILISAASFTRNLSVEEIFCATPTPITDPTRQWLVDTGIPREDDSNTAIAAPICVAYDFEGVRWVIRLPTFVAVVAAAAINNNNKEEEEQHKTRIGDLYSDNGDEIC